MSTKQRLIVETDQPFDEYQDNNIKSIVSVGNIIRDIVRNSNIDFKNTDPINKSSTYRLNSTEQSIFSSKINNINRTMEAINSMNSYLDSIKSPIKYIFMLFNYKIFGSTFPKG